MCIYYAHINQYQTVETPKVKQDITKHFSMSPFIKEPMGSQKVIFELRSETGMPLEAPLQISQVTLCYNNKPLYEYTLPNMYESSTHFYVQHAPYQAPRTVNILKYGAVFCNGYFIFNVPHNISARDLSLSLTHRSAKNVTVNIFMIESTKEYFFGQISVAKPYHWENTHLVHSQPQTNKENKYSYEDIIINKILCVNNEGEPFSSSISTNDNISIEIEYTAVNRSMFENIQLLITLRNKQTTKEYLIFTEHLRFNPLVTTHSITTPINIKLSPGEYDVVILVAKHVYGQRNTVSILALDHDGYHLVKNTVCIKIVEHVETQSTKTSEVSSLNIFYYN